MNDLFVGMMLILLIGMASGFLVYDIRQQFTIFQMRMRNIQRQLKEANDMLNDLADNYLEKEG